jgi:hypothetical protein
MSISTRSTISGLRYNVLKCIDLPSISFQCTVVWTGSTNNVKFPVLVLPSISTIIADNLMEISDSENSIVMDLVTLPEIGATAEWTGVIEDKDWSNMNNQQVRIEGSFRISPAGIEYSDGDMKYKFHLECKSGVALL